MPGEFFTKFTVWLALSGYALGVITFLLSNARRNWDATARIAWTAGCLSLIVHVGCAYHFYHDWSYVTSYKETARQTAKVYGIYWGGGLFVNYFLMTAWIADVIWWWKGLEEYRNRSKVLTLSWHAFLFFIFFNATVVFEGGLLRWIGLLFSIVIVSMLIHLIKRSQQVKRI